MKALFIACLILLVFLFAWAAYSGVKIDEVRSLGGCAEAALQGVLKIPDNRDQRFLGKVTKATAVCRGGPNILEFRLTPWIDWSQYWGTGDATSKPHGIFTKNGPAFRGVTE